jgi:hypothetical protein
MSTGSQDYNEGSAIMRVRGRNSLKLKFFCNLDGISEWKQIKIHMKYYLNYFSMRLTDCELIRSLLI